MSREWENTNYGKYRRLRLALVPLLLTVAVVSVFWLLRRDPPNSAAMPAAEKKPSRPVSVLLSVPAETEKPTAAIPDQEDIATEIPVMEDASGQEANAARQAADVLLAAGKFQEALAAYNRLEADDQFSRGRAGICLAKLGRWSEAVFELQAAVVAQPDDFIMRKWLARALYRQNELKAALEQVQAALALQADAELYEMQAKLEKEIGVQRNYDDASTKNFIVLFDGYEHEEMKFIVLDILKSAYAGIGKELDYFPEQPISVILYMARDFSDVTRAPMWAGGLFGKLDGKIRVPVQGASGSEQALRRVLIHEYTHALLYEMVPDCPLWLQEGLAQYFCGDRPVNIGQVIQLPLLNEGFPTESHAALTAYMECLQVVSDLVEEYGMPRLRRLLGKLGGGSGLETAFADAYGQPFSRWAVQWRPLQREE